MTGVFTGALYLPIVLQMMLGTGFLQRFAQATTLFFFPLCWATLGLGFLYASKGRRIDTWNASAAALLAFLFASHALPLQIDSQGILFLRLVICLIPAGMVYFFIGRELNELFAGSGTRIHLHYGVFLLGLAAGGAFSDQAVPVIGGNGLIVFVIAALFLFRLPLKIGAAAVPLAFALITWSGTDIQIERLRNVGKYVHGSSKFTDGVHKDSHVLLNNYKNAFENLAWNRRGQTFYYYDEEERRLAWVLNLQVEHYLDTNPKFHLRRFIHTQFKAGDKVLLIGVGSGSSFQSISSESLGKNIFAIERDKNTVDLIRENNLNPYVPAINYIAADGRAFLEQSDTKWDWIFLESAMDQRNTSPFQLFQPQFLYTKEAIDAYLSRLNEGGTLVIETLKAGHDRRLNAIKSVAQYLETIKSEGFQTRYARLVKRGNMAFGTSWAMARRGGPPLSDITDHKGRLEDIKSAALSVDACFAGYSDSAPFLDWMCHSFNGKQRFLLVTLGALFSFAFLTELIRRRREVRRASARPVRFIFLSQSIAHCFLFLGIAYSLRSIFGDEISTFYVFNITTTIVGALASFFIHRLITHSMRVPFTLQVTGLIFSFAWLAAALNMKVTFEGGLILRSLVFLSAVVPVYFMSALIFHESLGYARRFSSGVREAFLYDSIAVIPAYAVLPWILFDLGIGTLFIAAAAAYAASIALLYSTGSTKSGNISPANGGLTTAA